jgi:hypothetical protein
VWLTSVWLNGRTAFGLALVTSSWLRIDLLPVSLIAFTIGVILLDFTVQAAHVTSLSAIFTLRPDAHSRLVGGCMAFHSAGSAVGAIASTSVYAGFGWIGVLFLGCSLQAGRSSTLAPRESWTEADVVFAAEKFVLRLSPRPDSNRTRWFSHGAWSEPRHRWPFASRLDQLQPVWKGTSCKLLIGQRPQAGNTCPRQSNFSRSDEDDTTAAAPPKWRYSMP